MAALIFFLLNLGASSFKPKRRLEAENAALRQQLVVLQRKVRGRVQFTNGHRLFFIQLYRWFPSVLKAKGHPTQCVRSAELGKKPAHPSVMSGEFSPCYNSSHRA